MDGRRERLPALAFALATIALIAATATATAGTGAGGRAAPSCYGGTSTGGPTPGDDVIIAASDADNIDALQGDDRVCARPGNDRINGNKGDDKLRAEAGNDRARGEEGNDFLRGGADDDILLGNQGRDELRGGRGDDTLSGGEGQDRCYGGLGKDSFDPSCEEIFDVDETGGPDTTAPQTVITASPKAKTRKRRTRFKFTADEAGASFECKLDKKVWKKCSSPYRRWAKPGRHKFKVRATDQGGNVDPTPAKDRWKVKRKRR